MTFGCSTCLSRTFVTSLTPPITVEVCRDLWFRNFFTRLSDKSKSVADHLSVLRPLVGMFVTLLGGGLFLACEELVWENV